MKKSACSFLALCGLLSAAESPRNPVPDKSHTFVMTARSMPTIRCTILASTLFVLPSEEKVMVVFDGDEENWHYQTTKIPTRFLSIKPTTKGVNTDLHIISNKGNHYSFTLEEITGKPEGLYNAKVFVEAGDSEMQGNLTRAAEFVPAAELEAAKQAASDAQKHEQEVIADEKAKVERERQSFLAAYPSQISFAYEWNQDAGKKMGLERIWNDGRFTYIRGAFKETPALYEEKDGQPSLIDFQFADGQYTVAKILDHGYLAIGKAKVSFWSKKGGK